MPQYRTQLTARDSPCDGTLAMRLAKPPGFAFRAGQYLDVTLLDPPEMDTQGPLRSLSIASAPYEDHLLLAMRLRGSAFKRYLAQAPLGTELQIEGPLGSFTLRDDSAHAAVFLAGGIGITPFRGILRQAAYDREPRELFLFYGNHRLGRAAFLPELEALAKRLPRFHLVPLMSSAEDGWTGAVDRIQPALLRRHLPNLHGPFYYIAGPPEMVGGVRLALTDAGVDEDDIRSEEFSGY